MIRKCKLLFFLQNYSKRISITNILRCLFYLANNYKTEMSLYKLFNLIWFEGKWMVKIKRVSI